MRSLNQFIVRPKGNKRYNNTKNIGGIDFIVSTSEEDHAHSNRYAEVVSTPILYNGAVQKGDTLVVHHNVFKFYNDMKGRRKSGKSYFMNDLFLLDQEQFFLYGKEGEWKAHDRFCFVEPIPVEDSYIYKPISNEPLMGTMVYPSEYLISKGVTKGTKVSYKPDSEYEFDIDGKTMYRIYDHQITLSI